MSGSKTTGSGAASQSSDSSQTIKQTSQTDSAGSKTGSIKSAVQESDDEDAATKTLPPPNPWSFWRLFK